MDEAIVYRLGLCSSCDFLGLKSMQSKTILEEKNGSTMVANCQVCASSARVLINDSRGSNVSDAQY